jgi:DGQHR domain-containing protein
MQTKVKALRIGQKAVQQEKPLSIYLTALPAKMILDNGEVDTWRPDNPEGYQRPLVSTRLRDVAHYVTDEEGVLPTSVLICVRDADSVRFEVEGPINGAGDWGNLIFSEGAKLWVIDGQHRLYGIKQALEAGATALEDYPIPVSIFAGIDRFQEMRHFYLVNTRQKGVPTDVVDLHLAQMREQLGLDMRELTGRLATVQDREYRRARAVKVTRLLGEMPGPWQGAIRLPGEKPAPNYRQRLHAVVASLEPVLREQYTGAIPDDDLAILVSNYWTALSTVWPEAFEGPDEYQVLHTPGLYSLHMVFPDVIARCRDDRDFSKAKMKEIVSATGIATEFWHKERGDRMVIGTGMGSIRKLAEYIRERFPKLALPGLEQSTGA